jgi:hypothetical protein
MRTIQEIAQDMSTQDNDGTAEPMFVVQTRKRIFGMESDYGTAYAWISDDDEPTEACAETVAKLEALFKESCDDTITIPDADDPESETTYERIWYVDEWEFVTCCFTRTAAEEFVARNGHRFASELRVWTDSFHRNPEMIAVRDHLLKMTTPGV